MNLPKKSFLLSSEIAINYSKIIRGQMYLKKKNHGRYWRINRWRHTIIYKWLVNVITKIRPRAERGMRVTGGRGHHDTRMCRGGRRVTTDEWHGDTADNECFAKRYRGSRRHEDVEKKTHPKRILGRRWLKPAWTTDGQSIRCRPSEQRDARSHDPCAGVGHERKRCAVRRHRCPVLTRRRRRQ